MSTRKKDFAALMERQRAELHERIVELEELSAHATEHALSYDTVDCEARSKHIDTLRRLDKLDHECEEKWHEVGAEITAMVAEIRRDVERREGLTA